MSDIPEVLSSYDDDYLFFSTFVTNDQRTDSELRFIWDALQLKPGETVLDLGCGHGRISNGLATRGAAVTGVDVIPMFLERARIDAIKAGVTVDYHCGDIRHLPGIGPFDTAILWFFSFGYHDDEDNLKILKTVSRALKPGGRLLLDQYNPTALARAADHHSVMEFGDDLLIQRPIHDLETGRWGAERIAVRSGRVKKSKFMCRCYSPTEWKQMLATIGFGVPTFLGDGFGRLGLDSMKQILLAKKLGS